MNEFQLRAITMEDRPLVARLTEKHWGSRMVVAKARVLYPEEMQGFLATNDRGPVGLVTYKFKDKECEVVTMNSFVPGKGVGRALLNEVKREAVSKGCKRLWLITTNDNFGALRFYQKWGMRLAALYPNALEASRKLKPQIPLMGNEGIPIRDELELELVLDE